MRNYWPAGDLLSDQLERYKMTEARRLQLGLRRQSFRRSESTYACRQSKSTGCEGWDASSGVLSLVDCTVSLPSCFAIPGNVLTLIIN